MMKKLFAAFLICALTASQLIGCSGGGSTAPATQAASAETEAPAAEKEAAEPQAEANTDPIKIGCIQDTTGGASSAGQPNQWGAEYAVRIINENGGINGRPIEIYCRDCQNDTEVGVTVYRELVDEVGVCAIIGPPLSNPASAWVDLATEDKVPIVGHFMDEICTTDPDTGEAYPYMFLVEPSSAVQGYILAKYALDELGIKSVASLYNTSNAFAVTQEKPFVDYFVNNGGEVLAEETFGWADTDYSAQAQKIASLNPDAVLLTDYANQMVTAYDNLRDAGYEGYILGANTMAAPFNTLVKNPVKDCYYVKNYDFTSGKIADLVKVHMEETGTDYPSGNVGFGWDAVQVLASAMQQAEDPTNGEEVRDILENKTVDIESAGEVNITLVPETHRPTRDMGMFIVTYNEDGTTEEVQTYLTSDYKAE